MPREKKANSSILSQNQIPTRTACGRIDLDLAHANFLHEKIISVHAPKKATQVFFGNDENGIFTAMELELSSRNLKNPSKAPHEMILQGDFNINFLDAKARRAFIQDLERHGLAIKAVRTPPYKTDKRRGYGVDSAQKLSSNKPAEEVKDISFTIELMSQSIPDQEQTHIACLEELESLVRLPKRKFPEEVSVDHALSYTIVDGELHVTQNIISSHMDENKVYDPQDYEAVLVASKKLENAQWRDMLTHVFTRSELNQLLSNTDINEIELSSDYALRDTIQTAFEKKWKQLYGNDPQGCKKFVTEHYQRMYETDEFLEYNELLKPDAQIDLQKQQEIIDLNTHDDVIKYFQKRGDKIMTFFWMGGLKDPKRASKAREHFEFKHPMCFQINGGFAPHPHPTQAEIEKHQAQEFLQQIQAIEQQHGTDLKLGTVDLRELGNESKYGDRYMLLLEGLRREAKIKGGFREVDFDTVYNRFKEQSEDEVILQSLNSALTLQHQEYTKLFEKDKQSMKFKPNQQRMVTMQKIADISERINSDETLSAKEKVDLLIGLLEMNKKAVIYSHKSKSVFGKAGFTKSRLASTYDKIIKSGIQASGQQPGQSSKLYLKQAVEKFTNRYHEEADELSSSMQKKR